MSIKEIKNRNPWAHAQGTYVRKYLFKMLRAIYFASQNLRNILGFMLLPPRALGSLRACPSSRAHARSIRARNNKVNPILKRHNVKMAAVFGYYARGQEGKKNDIDILIEYKNGK